MVRHRSSRRCDDGTVCGTSHGPWFRKLVRNRKLARRLHNRNQLEQLRIRKLVRSMMVRHRSKHCACGKSSSTGRRTWGGGCSKDQQLRIRKPVQRFRNRKRVLRRMDRSKRCRSNDQTGQSQRRQCCRRKYTVPGRQAQLRDASVKSPWTEQTSIDEFATVHRTLWPTVRRPCYASSQT